MIHIRNIHICISIILIIDTVFAADGTESARETVMEPLLNAVEAKAMTTRDHACLYMDVTEIH